MAFRAAPDLAFRPQRQFAQLLHLGMVGADAVDHGQAMRVEHPRLGAEMLEQALRFQGQQAAE
ncbi:hypothetical protein D3C81_2328000 [compost metagenome]